MRNLLLSGVGALVLLAGPAFAHSYDPGSTKVDVSVPVKNAGADNGSNAATTGGTAGSLNGNTLSSTSSKSFSASNSFNKTSTRTVSLDKNLSATSGGSGGSASATTGGVAVNKPDSGNAAFALLGTAVSDGNLTQVSSRTDVSVTLASANSTADISHDRTTTGMMHEAKIEGSNVSMIYSMGGTGILTAQQNTGAAASQQNTLALSSIVTSGGVPHLP